MAHYNVLLLHVHCCFTDKVFIQINHNHHNVSSLAILLLKEKKKNAFVDLGSSLIQYASELVNSNETGPYLYNISQIWPRFPLS